jgi:hypothetical protein
VTFEKWWCVEREHRAGFILAENLDAKESARRLDAALVTQMAIVSEKGSAEATAPVAMTELWRYYDKSWLAGLLQAKLVQLEALRARVHPLYRPVVEEYQAAIEQLLQRKLSRFRRAVAIANQHRQATDRRVRQITEALDRVEQHDQISDYLDQFDK